MSELAVPNASLSKMLVELSSSCSTSLLTDISHLVSAVASLAWPVCAFTVIYLFRAELSNRLRSVTSWKGFGQEVSMSKDLDKLVDYAKAAEANAPEESSEVIDGTAVVRDIDGDAKVLSAATQSPTLGLMQLSIEIEQELRTLLAAHGNLQNVSPFSAENAAGELHRAGYLSSNLETSLKAFFKVRNQIVHGGQVSEQVALRAIDAGQVILRAIKSVPREQHIVERIGIELFSKSDATNRRTGVSGLMLRAISPGGTSEDFRVYPTTRTHFVVGKPVAWEWNGNNVWADTWYRDPQSGEIRLAWSSAMEFVGRNLDQL